MFSYMKGTLEEIESGHIILENHGIGYEIKTPMAYEQKLPKLGSEIKLYTYLQVKEDGLTLFGFLEKQELSLFQLLLSVNGVGPKGALGIFSVLTADGLRLAIATQDAKAISKAPGVGGKTAQRIILDLKDKIHLEDNMTQDAFVNANKNVRSNAAIEAVEALVALGFAKKEAEKAVQSVNLEADASVEDYLKQALFSLN